MKESYLNELVEEGLSYAKKMGASQAEVTARSATTEVTRFAANHIHQNVGSRTEEVSVRVVIHKKSGFASTSIASREGVHKATEHAFTLANLREEDPFFRGLPMPQDIPSCEGWSDATERFSAKDRALVVSSAIDESRKLGFTAAGVYAIGTEHIAIGNTLGLRSYHPGTTYQFTVTSMSPTSSGFAGQAGWDVRGLDSGALTRSAVHKANIGQNPVALGPGEYDVILEPEAAGVLFGFYARLALSGRAYEQGVSHVSGKLGQRVLGPNITMWDDGYDTRSIPRPFDREGVPKKKLMLIEKGVAKNVCYDSQTASLRPGLRSTGHAIPVNPYESGPIPQNLIVKTGDASIEDMIRSTKRGLWVGRLHYPNAIDYQNVVVTGITRDALLLIEDGVVVAPVQPMRFAENFVRALNNVQMLGSSVRYLGGFRGELSVPAVKIRRFRFIA